MVHGGRGRTRPFKTNDGFRGWKQLAKDDAAKSFGKCVVQCLCSDVGYVGESDQCVRMHVNGGNVAFGKEKLRVGMAWLVDMDSGGGSPDLAELLLLVHGWFQLCGHLDRARQGCF